MITALPQFFNYDENKVDSGFDALHNFFLSWTLKCSVDKYTEVDNKVQFYAKRILLHLLFRNEYTPCEILEIKIKKKLGYIDLLAEVTIKDNSDQVKTYVLNIENKWYSKVIDSELIKYSNALSDIYSDSDSEIVSVVLFPDILKLEENRFVCEKSGYKMKTFDKLKNLFIGEPLTGNALFDEFWFKFH